MQEQHAEQAARRKAIWNSTIGFHRLTEHFLPATQRLIELLEIEADDRVLDVATGTGRTAVAARETGAPVTGLDLSPLLLGEAMHYAESCDFYDIQFDEADAENLPYQDSSFSAALSTFGVIHTSRPDVAIREMDRVIMSGGRLGLAVWQPDCSLIELSRLFLPHVAPDALDVGVGKWGRRDTLRDMLSLRYFPEMIFEDGELELRYPDSAAAWRDWIRNYSPFRIAYTSVGPAQREMLDVLGRRFFERWRAPDGGIVWKLGYLLMRADKISFKSHLG